MPALLPLLGSGEAFCIWLKRVRGSGMREIIGDACCPRMVGRVSTTVYRGGDTRRQ